jgi:HEAT repeat protein
LNRRNHALTESERSRIEHVDRLVALGGRAVRDLIGALSESSWTVRRAVVAGLASLGDEAVPALCRWLRDVRSSEHAIAAAVDALATSIGSTVATEVLALADTPSPAVVSDAAQILGRRKVAAAAPRLAELVEHGDDNVAVAAIEALGAIGGTSAVETLVRVVESRRFFRTFPAIQVLARTGDPRAIPPLAALLSDDTYRLEVVRALGRTGSAHAIGPITSLLRSPSDAVVCVVAVALSELIERADWMGSSENVGRVLRTALAPWLGRFAKALHTGDSSERAAIARLLGRAGDATVLPAIAAMLEDAQLVSAATDALRHLDRASDEALVAALVVDDAQRRAAILPLVRAPSAAPAIRRLLADDDVEVRARACEALARVGDTSSVPAFFDLLGDASPRVAHAAVSAILTLGTADTEALALAAARANRPGVRRHAIRILGAFGYVAAFDTLRSAIDDSDRRLAELAIAGLGTIDDTRVDTVLGQLAASRDDALRAAVMRAAGLRGGRASAQLLARGLGDTSDWVRYYAAQGLGRIGGTDAPRSGELLVQHLHDPAPQVRIAVIEALSRLGSAEAWEAICRAAASADPDERRAGLVGLGMHTRDDAAALLVEAAGSADHATRLVAIAGLARQPGDAALAALDHAVGDANPELQAAALSLLAERDDEAAARVLVGWAIKTEPDHPAHRALSRPGANRVLTLLSTLANADERSAPILVAALARMHFEMATAALFEALALANPAARAAAASTLVSLAADGAVRAVTTLASTDPDPHVRRVCAAALASA